MAKQNRKNSKFKPVALLVKILGTSKITTESLPALEEVPKLAYLCIGAYGEVRKC